MAAPTRGDAVDAVPLVNERDERGSGSGSGDDRRHKIAPLPGLRRTSGTSIHLVARPPPNSPPARPEEQEQDDGTQLHL